MDYLESLTSGVKNIADVYVSVLNNKYAAGLAQSQSTIEELKAQTSLLAQQNQAQYQAQQAAAAASATFNPAKYMPYLLMFGGAFFVYKLIK